MAESLRCLNCDAQLSGEFCQACGQAGDSRLPTLPVFARNSLSAVLDVDGRVWCSVRSVLGRPGRMSGDYIEGRRAGYVHPVRLFTIVAVLVFGLASVVHWSDWGLLLAVGAGAAVDISEAWASWLVLLVAVPVMAAALKLLYARRRRRYLEHLIVSLEFFTALLVVAAVETGVGLLNSDSEALRRGAALVAGAYLLWVAVMTLHRVYGTSKLESLIGVTFLAAVLGTGFLVAVVGLL